MAPINNRCESEIILNSEFTDITNNKKLICERQLVCVFVFIIYMWVKPAPTQNRNKKNTRHHKAAEEFLE